MLINRTFLKFYCMLDLYMIRNISPLAKRKYPCCTCLSPPKAIIVFVKVANSGSGYSGWNALIVPFPGKKIA